MCKEINIVRNKSNLLLEIILYTHEQYNHLQFTQFNIVNTDWKLFTKDNYKFSRLIKFGLS